MELLVTTAGFVACAVMGALGFVILIQVLSGRISTRGLLGNSMARRPDEQSQTVSRVQLAALGGFALVDFIRSVSIEGDTATPIGSSAPVLSLLLASNAFYLFDKYSALQRRRKSPWNA